MAGDSMAVAEHFYGWLQLTDSMVAYGGGSGLYVIMIACGLTIDLKAVL